FVFVLLVLTFALTAGVLFLFGNRDPRALNLGGNLLLVACAFANTLLENDAHGVRLLATYVHPQFFVGYFFWNFAMRFPNARPFERYHKTAVIFVRLCVAAGATLACFSLFVGFLVFLGDPSYGGWISSLGRHIQNEGWMVLLVLELPALSL